MTGKIRIHPINSWMKTGSVLPGITNGKLKAKQKTKKNDAVNSLILLDIIFFAASFPLREKLLHNDVFRYPHIFPFPFFVMVKAQKMQNSVDNHESHLFVKSRPVFSGMACDNIRADEDVT